MKSNTTGRYSLEISKNAKRDLKKMDIHQSTLILTYLYNHVDGIDDPRKIGKGLKANRAGQWRYRIGKYRVISNIEDERLVVMVINVGHRREYIKQRD